MFDKVDWEARRLAYMLYKCTQRISIRKLVNGLYHTKYEMNKMNGGNVDCQQPKTLGCLFCCSAHNSTKHRHEAKGKLHENLHHIKTSEKLVSTLLHGIDTLEILDDKEQPLLLF